MSQKEITNPRRVNNNMAAAAAAAVHVYWTCHELPRLMIAACRVGRLTTAGNCRWHSNASLLEHILHIIIILCIVALLIVGSTVSNAAVIIKGRVKLQLLVVIIGLFIKFLHRRILFFFFDFLSVSQCGGRVNWASADKHKRCFFFF